MGRTIVVVDADEQTRAVARDLADREGCSLLVAASGTRLTDRLRGERPALVVIATELDDHASALDVMVELLDRFGRDLPVVLISATRTDPFDRVAGLLLGADDYVLKPFDVNELRARLLRSLRRSRRSPSGSVSGTPIQLSAREFEVLGRLAAGRSQAEIAQDLFISSKNVATHIQHLMAKLGVHSRAQAVSAAYRLGLIGDQTIPSAPAR